MRPLSWQPLPSRPFYFASKLSGVGENGQSSNGQRMPCFHSRPYSSDDNAEMKLQDILRQSVEKKDKLRYPEFDDHKGQQKKLGLKDLINELKGDFDTESHSKNIKVEAAIDPDFERKSLEVSKTSIFESKSLSFKTDPWLRVKALQKHSKESDILKGPAKKGSTILDVNIDNDKNTGNSETDLVSQIHKKGRDQIIPDETEVGGLLAALIDGKMDESNVKEVMANMKPTPDKRFLLGTSTRRGEKFGKKFQMAKDSGSYLDGTRKPQMFSNKMRLFSGVRSHYLDGLFSIPSIAKDRNFISIHETKWQREVKDSVPKLGPSDGFEAIMLNSEKMWKFPVDNEEGLDEKENSNFEDHVFLDHYLDLFPEKGQIRKFMELVITGLQQNPFCTVEQKIEQINWFKTYFDKFGEVDLEF
ncbi:small ribosomal subunit protein mS31-like [Rhopilema esculentum]|uniref:small ribosomal subunit protein mS31-like n=1 Tax=Rhopilema esculentum TaxID=499914 RepID=UPI0031DFC5A7|eukprot:gene6103-11491_t